MKINHMNCTIELTKTEMKAAEKFGSEMYLNLREARQDNPNYRVKVVAPSKKVDRHKGLTADAMKKFILKHDDENQTMPGRDSFSKREKKSARQKNTKRH